MKSTSHHRRWITASVLVAFLVVALAAWALDTFHNATAVDGIRDGQYINAWLAKQQAGLQSGNQSDVYFYDTRGTDDLLHEFARNSAIEGLTFELTDLSDDGVQIIAELPNIERLTLYGGMPRVGDRGLGFLDGHSSLATLKLVNVDVTDHGLAVLRTLPRLNHLTLYREGFRETLLTDNAVVELQKLTGLTTLNIVGGWMSQSAIDDLRASLPDCDVVVETNWMRDDEQSVGHGAADNADSNG